jgi:hypothetical protein
VALVNDPDFRASLADFNSFVEKLSERIIEIDDTIPELPLKDLVSNACLTDGPRTKRPELKRAHH